MFDNEIREQAKKLGSTFIDSKEEKIFSDAKSSSTQEDAAELWERAYEREQKRRENTSVLEENEKKYEAAEVSIYLNKDGNTEERTLLAKIRYDYEGDTKIKFTALGYERYPEDIKQVIGDPDKVIDQWISLTPEMESLHYAFITYAHHDNEGHGTWEEYRDAKGFGKQEDIAIENVQNAYDNDKPRETPSVEQDTENLIKR